MNQVVKLAELLKAAYDRAAPEDGVISVHSDDKVLKIHLTNELFDEVAEGKPLAYENWPAHKNVHESFKTRSGCMVFTLKLIKSEGLLA